MKVKVKYLKESRISDNGFFTVFLIFQTYNFTIDFSLVQEISMAFWKSWKFVNCI